MATKITLTNTTAQYVPVNAQGYDSAGRYWGTGERLYRLEAKDYPCATIVNKWGHELGEWYIRAPNAWLARALANEQGYGLAVDGSGVTP